MTRPLVTEAMGLLDEIVVEIHTAMDRVRKGDLSELKDGVRVMRDLRSALQIVFEERAKVAKLREDRDGGGAGERALDLDAARDEICRRLARLRDAADG
ncbi:hypothetical protein [Albidovulum sp.]|uniref:hypothetical protein n=1 Tax=Albidovulum sp. TaxID=1872424 RepID=UPI0039B9C6D6